MAYIDTKYLGKCETCRNFRNGKCNTSCDHGEEYSPNLSKIPTADVVSRSEYDDIYYKLLGVMHSVDKWLDGEELAEDEVNRAATMREKVLQILENKDRTIRSLSRDLDKILKETSDESK